MKALPMLDHVMLWYARVFTTFLLIIGFIRPVILMHFHAFPYGINLIGVIFLLWAVSCWSLNSDTARLYLGLSAAAGMGVIIYLFFAAGDFTTYTKSGVEIDVQGCLILVSILASIAPLIWVAIRPPRKVKLTPTASKLQHDEISTTRKRFWFHFFSILPKTPLPSFR